MKTSKILVTGADGFIGSHVVENLLEKGYSVKAFVYYNSFNSYGWLDSLPKEKLKKIEIFSGDIRDPNGVRNAVKGCDAVMHLAALIAIPFSYHSPDSYVDTNMKGTLNILNACRDLGVQKLLVTSTSEVYGTAKYVPIDEDHPLQGQSPYSATKIGADQLALSFYRSFDLPVTIVRPFNTYGPRQSARAVIPTIISQALSGKKEIHLGSLHPTRDLVFVKDTAEGFLRILEHKKTEGEVINISTQKEISVGDLAKMILELCGSQARVKCENARKRPTKSEVERLLGSNRKLVKLTGWKPDTTIEEGLKKTVEWFANPENLKLYKPDVYNV
ncbi:MAG: NAD-dependent 4,6-dehydratase LegB [Elusimicrobia bacterium]|nr:NAD-dependent 4,6-dehydratase LegB [Elusimicrobiota bacterium]